MLRLPRGAQRASRNSIRTPLPPGREAFNSHTDLTLDPAGGKFEASSWDFSRRKNPLGNSLNGESGWLHPLLRARPSPRLTLCPKGVHIQSMPLGGGRPPERRETWEK